MAGNLALTFEAELWLSFPRHTGSASCPLLSDDEMAPVSGFATGFLVGQTYRRCLMVSLQGGRIRLLDVV